MDFRCAHKSLDFNVRLGYVNLKNNFKRYLINGWPGLLIMSFTFFLTIGIVFFFVFFIHYIKNGGIYFGEIKKFAANKSKKIGLSAAKVILLLAFIVISVLSYDALTGKEVNKNSRSILSKIEALDVDSLEVTKSKEPDTNQPNKETENEK